MRILRNVPRARLSVNRRAAARVYAARVSSERHEFVAAPVQDERQLDGAWHLELAAESDDADATPTTLALRLVIDREGTVAEGELTLSRGEMEESGLIDAGALADPLEPLEITLDAEFGGREIRIAVAQRDDGDFDLRVEPGAAS